VVGLLEAKAVELNAMVESILIAARLHSGRVELASQRVDLSKVVGEAVHRANTAASLTGGAVIARNISDNAVVAGDARQLAVIVYNLLANAIKFSRLPAVVTATLQSKGGFAEVRVTDSGRGIPRDQWDRVFEEFVRGDSSDAEAPAGTGLGLYIARRLAEGYGGSVAIEWSEVGKGTSFLFRIPLAMTVQ